MLYIDLNCDMGENFGVYSLGNDEEIMPYVTSINVACGFHASDPANMRKTVKLAKKYGVAVGAHPSLPDLVGFGRRAMSVTPDEIKADFIYQIGALQAFCHAEGVVMQHVKDHGAITDMANNDLAIAIAMAEAIQAVDSNLYMVCLANSLMVKAAKTVGIPYVEEAYADRAYTDTGSLVSRKQANAVIHDAATVRKRVLGMMKEKQILSINGSVLPINAQTICLHGDTPGAIALAKELRSSLESSGVTVQPFGKSLRSA
ncbi:5-oxoprolinase subunit A [Sporomusa silvacetica DSM 10669]|uniref:5-oxoprolinase subunit A n=1 Tax=Sporomusa silvacetica DSM 10669 TaxID=1123289 RepID=A0ABZ3ITW9_9FIRM|nr:5-oxoprolinase subunit PxpA [Sporomusa silvacetica]OZC19520.1 LamB/YcsF family protein [Sporomusa silvacetica DSM 10669]